MDESQYVEQRVDDQIKWYSNKSGWNQKMYKRFSIAQVICASIIPLVLTIGSDPNPFITVVASALGVAVVIMTGIISMNKYQENWIQYRTTSEMLKHEKYLFLTNAEPYGGEKAFSLFVQRIESLISKENSAWSSYITKKEEKTTGKP